MSGGARVLVLGAGVAGVASAYFLARQGHQVMLVDQASEPGAGTSHANGGQLSYSYTDAFAQPAMLKKLPGLLLGRDPSVVMSLSPSLIRWGLAFVSQCTAGRSGTNSRALLELALRSADLLGGINREAQLDYSHATAGKMVLLRTDAEVQGARPGIDRKTAAGCDVRLLNRQEAEAIEPTLAAMPEPYTAAIYAPGDEVADAGKFCRELSEWLQTRGSLELKLGTRVDGLLRRNGRVTGAKLGSEELEADAVVVCLGGASASVVAPSDIPLPIYPVRGYSLTLPPGPRSPRVSLTDVKHKIVFSRLGDRVRIAGFTDFLGNSESRIRRRVADLTNTAWWLAPEAADYAQEDHQPWSGVRPMTPDSRPRVGATRTPGLFVNTGHGALGWTLACATGQDVARAVSMDT